MSRHSHPARCFSLTTFSLSLITAIIILCLPLRQSSLQGAETATPVFSPWYCVGPFKDKLNGLHRTSFAHVFPPEKEILESKTTTPDLSRSWQAEHFIGEENPTRRWEKHPQWIDGYMNYLPHGPAPMKNETCYLYRKITTEEPMTVSVRIDALDNIRLWHNGTIAGEATNPAPANASRFAASLNASLKFVKGDNHLLVKITSMHGLHGFAFAMPPYTITNKLLPGQGYRSDRPDRSPMAVVRDFRFSVEPIPMFDPPRLRMAEALEKSVPGNPKGKEYLQRLQNLKRSIKQESINSSASLIDAFWTKEITALPPVAFIRCPPFRVNAIAPYSATGASPAEICVFDPARPKEPVRTIFHDPAMTLFGMNLSWDGKTIFFTGKKGGYWHLYEIGVNGKNLQQITAGDHHNISPTLLPNGEIMFVSTRRNTRVMCQPRLSGTLFVANRDGSNVRQVSGNTLSDHTPQVLNNGQVIFTRWDYGIDKNVFCRQNLWTMNPDGSRLQLFGSNTKEDPNGFWQPRAIPGRPGVVCCFGGHHNYHTGMIGLVWNQGSGRERDRRGEGFRWITDELPTVGDFGVGWTYQNPFPLHEHLFLVSYGGDGENKNRLYLLDDRGNRRMIHQATGKLGCWNPLPLMARQRPPVIPSTTQTPEYVYRDPAEANCSPSDELSGTFILQDVYIGLGPHIKRGEIKGLQIIEQVPRSRETEGNNLSLWGQWVAMSRGTMYARRLIGTVPVEEDGSAHFTAPALRDISFNAVDAEGRTIRRMGSTLHIMPGETQSCVGCHETRGSALPKSNSLPLASRRAPSVPKYPKWTDKGLLDFPHVIQPVLDKYCVKCHSGPLPKGALDLSGDKTHYFSMAYDSLLDRGLVHYIPIAGTGHEESTGKARGSYISKIRKYIEKEHYGPPLPLEERRKIYAWIDANAPYYGTYVSTNPKTFGCRDRWYVQEKDGWFMKDYKPLFDRRCMGCHKRHVTPQTYNYNPRGGSILVSSTMWDDLALSQFQHGHGRVSRIGQYGPSHRINLTHPDWSRALMAPLAKEKGGFGMCREKDGSAVFKDKTDPDYQAILAAIRKGHQRTKADPRVDMPQAKE